MKVVVKIEFNIDIDIIYSKIIPLKSKREINQAIRNLTQEYAISCVDLSSGKNIYDEYDLIVNGLIEDGYAKRIEG